MCVPTLTRPERPETLPNQIDLRVLLEPRLSDPNIWVATCLETGYIATGLGYDEAREAILTTLRNEVLYAQGNSRKLTTRSPIPVELENRWNKATSKHPPERIPLFPQPERKPPGRVTKIKHVAMARAVR